jgi:ankyrin repeat protein
VKYLVKEKGTDVKNVNKDGATPLHWAAENGKFDVVKYLVEEKGAMLRLLTKMDTLPCIGLLIMVNWM